VGRDLLTDGVLAGGTDDWLRNRIATHTGDLPRRACAGGTGESWGRPFPQRRGRPDGARFALEAAAHAHRNCRKSRRSRPGDVSGQLVNQNLIFLLTIDASRVIRSPLAREVSVSKNETKAVLARRC
jgi:hypothetical protein